MAPRFKQNMYQTYKKDIGTDALICFANWDESIIFKFRDMLTEILLKTNDLYLNKWEGEPTEIDSCYSFFNPKDKEVAQTFFNKNYPGCLSWIFKTKAWNEYKKEQQAIKQITQIEMCTSHDYPCIDLYSSLHTEDKLRIIIEETSKKINIDMHYNSKLPPMSDIIMSNKKFDLLKT